MVEHPWQGLRRVFAALVLAQVGLGPTAQANVVGVDVQNFNPVTDGLDFVTVHSSQTLECCIVNLGLFANYARDTLPLIGEGEGAPTGKSHDSVTGGDLNIGFGLMRNWDMGISVPQILAQQVHDSALHGEFKQNGNTEVRVNTKVKVWGEADYGVAIIGSVNFNRLKNNPYTGSGAGATSNLEAAADTTVGGVRMALNLGYRFRRPGQKLPQFPIEPFHDQYIESVAASYLVTAIDTKVIAEFFASQPAKRVHDESDRSSLSSEALLGLKYDVTSSLALHIGAGTRIGRSGVSTPDWRVYGGLNYAFGPICNAEDELRTLPPTKQYTVEVEEEHVATNTTPAPKPKPEPQPERVVLRDIKFAFDSSTEVLPGTKDSLDMLVAYLAKPPAYKTLAIEGYTDSVGSPVYNQRLSERRAKTVRQILIDSYHLDPNTIKAVGYGAANPIADNGNYQGRQRNRRVEFKIGR